MSVADAAAICENVSAQYITALEAAEVKFPAPFALHALAGVYVISYIKLMELAGHVRPNPLTGELKAHELT